MDYLARSEKIDYSFLKTPEAISKRNTPEIKAKRIAQLKDPEFTAIRIKNTDFQAKADNMKKVVIQYDLNGNFGLL